MQVNVHFLNGKQETSFDFFIVAFIFQFKVILFHFKHFFLCRSNRTEQNNSML